jgi:hypothetical protein
MCVRARVFVSQSVCEVFGRIRMGLQEVRMRNGYGNSLSRRCCRLGGRDRRVVGKLWVSQD